MKIKFIDLQKQNQSLRENMLASVGEVLNASDFILGEKVRLFEERFADYNNVKYAVGVASGTDALMLALLGLGIGPGDEVICPVFTYIATALSISYLRAKPVFVDVAPQSFNIDPAKIESRITKKTKAIIAVHLYGQAADMSRILAIAKKHKIKVIEDCAQAHGTLWRSGHDEWIKAGSIGDAGCFSFYPTKNLGACGDAGIVLTNNPAVKNKLLELRDQGRKGKNRYLHYSIGYNSRLDSVQAAVLLVKLKYLEKYNALRQRNAGYYNYFLNGNKKIVLPYQKDFSKDVFYNYVIQVNNREKIRKKLAEKGVPTSVNFFPPLHLQKAYKELLYKKGDFPVAEETAKKIICLPMYPELSKKHIKYVAGILNDAV